jgi:hypothetical protein
MTAPAIALLSTLALLAAAPAADATERDPHQRALFMKKHPCPANGNTRGACPGYVVDHIKPLCAGGADRPSNRQWQTREEAKIKDRREREICRSHKVRTAR